MIAHNEKYLRNNAFTVRTQTGEKRCSIDDCEEIIRSRDDKHVILYFSDYEIFVYYQGQHIHLTIDQAQLLREFMLRSSEGNPLNQVDLFDYVGDVPANTFITRIRRLREKLVTCNIPSSIIQTRPREGDRVETAYYYNRSFPYIMIQRTDLIQ